MKTTAAADAPMGVPHPWMGAGKLPGRISLDALIRDYVVRHIVDRGLNAGDPLPSEAQLAEVLGVGRSSIREAVRKLQSLGIVEIRHGTGLFVRETNFDPLREIVGFVIRFSPSALEELGEVRFLLERAAIEEVVPRIGAEDIGKLEEILESWRMTIRDGKAWDSHDNEFHRTLSSPLGNDMLTMLLKEFWASFEQLDDPLLHEPRSAAEEYEDHRAILDAVKAGDAVTARLRLMKHFDHLRECIVRMRKTNAARTD